MARGRVRSAPWWALVLLAAVLAGCARTLSGLPQPGATLPPSGPTASASSAPSSTPVAPTPGSSAPAPTSSSPVPSVSAAPSTGRTSWVLGSRVTTAPKNAYGDYQIRIGQVVGLHDGDTGQDSIVWVVDSIKLDQPCVKNSDATSSNGHFLFLALRIELRNASAQTLSDANVGFSNDNWDAFDAKGVAQPNAGAFGIQECAADNLRPPDTDKLVAGKPVSAVVVLDVRATSGTVLLHFVGIDGGWEYRYG